MTCYTQLNNHPSARCGQQDWWLCIRLRPQRRSITLEDKLEFINVVVRPIFMRVTGESGVEHLSS